VAGKKQKLVGGHRKPNKKIPLAKGCEFSRGGVKKGRGELGTKQSPKIRAWPANKGSGTALCSKQREILNRTSFGDRGGQLQKILGGRKGKKEERRGGGSFQRKSPLHLSKGHGGETEGRRFEHCKQEKKKKSFWVDP